MNHFAISLICLLFSLHLCYGQQTFIKHVPDYSQPPSQTLPSTSDITNYCAPFAFLNIVEYWDSVQVHPYARGLMAGLPAKEVAEHIGWFMDTNDQGNPGRENGTGRPSAKGTYMMDQWMGADEYVRFDTVNLFGFPYAIPAKKQSYGWDVQFVPDFDFILFKDEIDLGNPVKLDFKYWSVSPTGSFIYDTELAEDTVFIYKWNPIVQNSGTIDESDPVEFWNLEEGEGGIGHAVTAVGYLEHYVADTSYVIVHDNWANTPENIAVPWIDTKICGWFFYHLPEPPDLTVSNIQTTLDTCVHSADSLWVGKPVTVRNTIDNLNNTPQPAFFIETYVKDTDGNTVASASEYVSSAIVPAKITDDSLLVYFDSLFVPTREGRYEITSRVYWDQNSDTVKNDSPDGNASNDQMTINRTAYSPVIYHSMKMIANVPDVNQPPTVTLSSTNPVNFCAPMAAVNITTYWDAIKQHSNATGVNAGLPPEEVAEYLGWFMDTHDKGNPLAKHGSPSYPTTSGTYTIDQDSFFTEYVRWDAVHPYPNVPAMPAGKQGYDWTFNTDYTLGISYYENEINSERPAKIDFLHWNITFNDSIFIDSLTQDTVFVYGWDDPSENSGDEHWEEWNQLEGPQNIGHAVTGVGYFYYGKTNTFYAVVHDNWSRTHREVAVPWRNWVATISVSPQPPSSVSNEEPIIRDFALYQNHPNPFNPKTVISYQLPVTSYCELSIYNLLGQKVATLVSEKQPPGTYNVEWDASGFPSGVYFCRLSTKQGFIQTKKLVLLR